MSTPREPASFFSRVIAHCIDGLFLGMISYGFLYFLLGFYYWSNKIQGSVSVMDLFDHGMIQTSQTTTYLFFALIYYTVAHVRWGKTLGKRVMKISVIDGDFAESKPDWIQSLIRTFGYVLSYSTLGIGYLLPLFDRRGRALQDWLAGTYVVKDF